MSISSMIGFDLEIWARSPKTAASRWRRSPVRPTRIRHPSFGIASNLRAAAPRLNSTPRMTTTGSRRAVPAPHRSAGGRWNHDAAACQCWPCRDAASRPELRARMRRKRVRGHARRSVAVAKALRVSPASRGSTRPAATNSMGPRHSLSEPTRPPVYLRVAPGCRRSRTCRQHEVGRVQCRVRVCKACSCKLPPTMLRVGPNHTLVLQLLAHPLSLVRPNLLTVVQALVVGFI